MQKNLFNRRILLKLMRITFIQSLAVLLCVGMAYAHDARGQEVLNRRITLNLVNQDIEFMLEKIEKAADVRFLYSFELIKANRKVSLEVSNERLEKVLETLFRPLNVTFEATNKQTIVLKRATGSSALQPTEGKELLPNVNPPAGIPVTGRVLDENDSGLPGVNIKIKNSTRGTTTNSEGRFTLELEKGDVLMISFVGYRSQELRYTGQTNLNIELVPDNKDLGEVVVIGYGTQSKKLITTSIASVSGKDLQEIKAPGLDQALQGRAAGVQVTKNTGAPGGGVSIRIRGTASFFSGQEPLYIVDGVPIDNTPTGSADILNRGAAGADARGQAGNEFVNPISQIPMEDIESIDILKDAASASIYGARAANGVVMITTKKGKKGKLRVSLNGYYGFTKLPESRRYKMLNAQGFAQMANEFNRVRRNPVIYRDSVNLNLTDWQDAIFRSAPVRETNLSLSGGTDNVTYSTSIGYSDQNGTLINSYYRRFNARNNMEFTFNKRLKGGLNVLYSRATGNRLRVNGNSNGTSSFNNNNVYGGSILSGALLSNPAMPIYKPTGEYLVDTLNPTYNPAATAYQATSVNTDNRVIANAFVEWEFLNNLKLRSTIGTDIRTSYEQYISPREPGITNGGAIENGNFNSSLWQSDNYLTYDLKKDRHNANFLAGVSFQDFSSRGFSVRTRGNLVPVLETVSAGNELLALREQGFQEWGIISYFGRVQYNYDAKYLFNATIRRDGSSRFGPDRRYGTFPSASVGWIASNEGFLKGNDKISLLKFKASYGITGNDQLGDAFEWRSSYRVLPFSPVPYLQSTGIFPTAIAVNDFSWEQTKQLDLGMELGLLKDRVNLTVDYYNKTSDGLLFTVDLPNTTGFTTRTRNVGSIENKGWEIGVNTKNVVTKKFNWTTSFNISFNQNKVLGLYEGRTEARYGDFGIMNLLRVGEPISWQALDIEKINPETGDWVLRDVDADGRITDADLVIKGSPLPKHFGGLNNTFTYGNWSLGAFFTWSYGNVIQNNARSYVESADVLPGWRVPNNITEEFYAGVWKKPGDIATGRGLGPNSRRVTTGGRPVSLYLEDGSFLRLRTLSIGYNVPREFCKKLGVGGINLYANGNNVWLLTNYRGYDPEVNHNNVGANITVGYDNMTYPQASTYVLGFNIAF
jgi:TonB-dependent starch-binding outer membrane protein SusC